MSPGVKGQRAQQIIFDEAVDEVVCPLCGKVVPADEAVWRDHMVRGTRVSFRVCAQHATWPLCPASLHGVHGEIIEEDPDPATGYALYGHCVRCHQPFEFHGESIGDNGWYPTGPSATVAEIVALNDRLQRGDIDMDEYLRELSPLVGVEGSNPAADTVSERED